MCKKIACGLFAATLFFVLAATGFGGQNENVVAYKKISAQDAKAIMDSGEPYLLLDVRTEAEFLEGHIAGAVLIPHTEIKTRAAGELQDKDALILVYCRSGRRSADAAKELVRQGYTQVRDFGGINGWPYGVVTKAHPRSSLELR